MTEDPKTALVTGASMGMGLEYARLFARNGHDVVLVARSEDKLESLAKELSQQHGVAARALPADLSDPGAPRRIVKRLAGDDVPIEFLINNAGFGALARLS